MEHGADINKEDCDGWTPLFSACFNEHIEIVKYLVEHGTNINKERDGGFTPLHIAFRNGHIEIVKYLVEHGADIIKNVMMVLHPCILHVKMYISK